MTRNQLNAGIKVLLEYAQHNLDEARAYKTEFTRDSWIASMVTSKVSSALADAFIAMREAEQGDHPNAKEKTPPAH